MTTFIKKISKIKNFGSFENFSWPTNLPEFKKNNLFYGKNGSGKTTLSHFLQCNEKGQFPDDFKPSPSIEIITEQGSVSDLSTLSGKVKVFNTYYISDNLFWDAGHANNLLWLGQANIEIQNAIEKLDKEIEKLNNELPILEKNKTESSNKLEKFLTDYSRNIRSLLGYNQSEYQKTHLQKDYDNIIAGKTTAVLLSDEDCNTKQELAKAKSTEPELQNCNSPKLNLKEVSSLVRGLLREEIVPANKIDELAQNPALQKWVKDGLSHHHQAGECKFCKQPNLTEQRLKDLRGFFDDVQEKFLTKLKSEISNLSRLISGIEDTSAEKVKITISYAAENEEVMSTYKKQCKEIVEVIQILSSSLQNKENDPYSKFDDECNKIENIQWDKLEEDYTLCISKINEIRKKHNQHVKNFESNKKNAQRDVILHFVSQRKDEYETLNSDKEQSLDKQVAATLDLKNKTSERAALKSKISSSHKAAGFINNLIKQMGHSHIKLEYDDEKQAYFLKRGGTIAKRLSEGEKTSIAFAHFIASLEEKEFDKSKSVIVIDDPISSLDANSCYFIYGLVKALEKEVNQLFLMTHNYSFFILLIKHFRDKKHYGHYEIHRITKPDSETGYSEIVEMCKSRITYYSEYNYLFSQISSAANDIKKGTSIEFDRLYNLMNCSRKLLEAFLGFKYPNVDKLENKWKKASEDYSIDEALQSSTFKVINFGSHSGIDSLFTGSGLDSTEMAQCVSLVLDFVKKVDTNHYDGMVLCETN